MAPSARPSWALAPPAADDRFVDGDARLELPVATGRGRSRAIVWVDRVRTLGFLMVAFALHQLFVTDLLQQRAQQGLRDDFLTTLEQGGAAVPRPVGPGPATSPMVSATSTSAPPGSADSASVPALDTQASVVAVPATVPPAAGPSPAPPDRGDAVALLAIPSIGVDEAVVEGVDVADLRRAPGHVPGTPLPGQQGNAVIAGHRTTYGAPFSRLDAVEMGDEILVRTLGGGFVYVVSSTEIVRPDQVEIVENRGDDRLTLITCHPRYSARQRLVVTASFSHFLDDAPEPGVAEPLMPGPASTPVSTPEPATPAVLSEADAPAGAGQAARVQPPLPTPVLATATPQLPAPESEVVGVIDLGNTVGLLDDTSALWPILGWGLVIVGLRRWSRDWSVRAGRPLVNLVSLPVVLVALVPWFEAISHALPANY